MYTEAEVLDFVKEENVKFVRLAFFSLDGKQKNISIMANELPRAFKYGVSFDASSIKGFQQPNKSDLFLHPDPTTLVILPWRPTNGKVIRMFCDIKYPDGTFYEKDCRHLLKQAIIKAEKQYNIELMFGSEIEFYLFKLDENGQKTKVPFDNAGYMDIAPEDKGENIRRDICFTLEDMGIMPETSHHEKEPGQNEIDFHYGNALESADNTSTFKWIVNTKAAANGLYATFCPYGPRGGMHINISCHNKNPDDHNNYFENILAGVLKHIEEIIYFLSPNGFDLVNSKYKYISWDYENRSQLIRIPASKNEQRLELRYAQPECNPYIVFSLLIEAALDGINQKMQPPKPLEINLFDNKKMIPDCKLLPKDIYEAMKISKDSAFIKTALGESLLNSFIQMKG